jgi:CDP-glycerol glycerophosphotransferase (TagB/SpsB family)
MTQEFEKVARDEAARAVFPVTAEQTLRMLSGKKRKTPSVLVLGRDGFSDNSKYLYLALASRSSGFPVYWGTFNSKLHAELTARHLPSFDLSRNPAEVLAALLEISCVVYCTNPAEATRSPLFRAALAGAHKLQLWHGIGLKRLDLQSTSRNNLLNPSYLAQLAGAVDIDEVLSPSSLYDDQWREAFGVDRVLRAGFPRNEVLVRPASENEMIGAPTVARDFCEQGFILFAPTFTPYGATPAWAEPQLLNILETFAQRLGLGLLIKPHPFDREPAGGMPKRGLTTTFLGSGTDVYPVLRHARALVTDLSSMASDFLLCDRPIFFFRSKVLEEHDYPERCMPELPGKHVREESVEAFMAAWESIEETAVARQRLRQLYFETDPLQACDAVIRRLVEVVQRKPSPNTAP